MKTTLCNRLCGRKTIQYHVYPLTRIAYKCCHAIHSYIHSIPSSMIEKFLCVYIYIYIYIYFFFHQVSIQIVHGVAKEKQSYAALFRDMVKRFRAIIDNSASSNRELTVAIKGYGYFAAVSIYTYSTDQRQGKMRLRFDHGSASYEPWLKRGATAVKQRAYRLPCIYVYVSKPVISNHFPMFRNLFCSHVNCS